MIKLKIILIAAIAFCTISLTQTSSSYTRYGIGDIYYTYSARSLGLGQSGVAKFNKDYVELLNPASWTKLNLTRLEFSLVLNGVQLSTNQNSSLYTDADFRGFTFAFPISEKYGIGVASGLIPYSRVSYIAVTNNSEYTSTYKGSGGISRLFVGASYRLPFGWIFGATAEYYFGKQTYTSKVEYVNSSYFPSEFDLTYRSTGFGTTLGIISQNFADIINDENISDLRLGLSLNLISDLNTDSSFIINPRSIADTVASSKTKMSLPFRFSGGISLLLKNVLAFNLDYIYQPWSDYNLGGKYSPYLKDTHKFNFGFEYSPNYKLGMSVWEQMIWRAGLSYELTQYRINGNDIVQFSIFSGLSYPIGIENTIDIGLEYSIRGTTDFNLIRENIYRINLGISFGDLWFQRFEK